MAKHYRASGSLEAKGATESFVDVAAGFIDNDSSFVNLGAKGPDSLGVKIRSVLAGVTKVAIQIAAAGTIAFNFDTAMASGTTLAAQALTATTYVGSSTGQFGGRVGINTTPDATYWLKINAAAPLSVLNGDSGIQLAQASPDVWRFTSGTIQLYGTVDFGGNVGNGGLVVGAGGTGSTQVPLQINGGSANGGGPFVMLTRNATLSGYLTTQSVIDGGGSSNVALYATTGLNVKIYSRAALALDIGTSATWSIPVVAALGIDMGNSAITNITGLTMTSGTAALQAITGTTITMSSTIGSSWIPTSTASNFDLGSSTSKWRDGWFSRNVDIAGTLTVGTFSPSSMTLTGTVKSEGFYEDFGTTNVTAGTTAVIKTLTVPGLYLAYADEAGGGATKYSYAFFYYNGSAADRITGVDGGHVTLSLPSGTSIQVGYPGGFGGSMNIRWRIVRFGSPTY